MDRLDSRPQVSGMMTARKPYPSDVSDEEWALAAPYLTLLPETAAQRTHWLKWLIPLSPPRRERRRDAGR